MAENRRDSDLSSELYFSVYGNNRKLEPQKIKAYALYKPLLENTLGNNFVVAAKETNEIFITFKEGSRKAFTFDKVFYCDIPRDDFYFLYKCAIQDVIMGLNSFLILSKLASPSSKIKNVFEKDLPGSIVINVLKELLLFVNSEENMDCSLHVSYFEVHGDKLIDHLNVHDENRAIEMYENPGKGCVEIKGLIEKPIINDKDIPELFSAKSHNFECSATCCHSIIFVSLVRRNISNDGLEFIKVGKLTLVSPAECQNSCLGNIGPSVDDCLLKFSENEFSSSSKSKILCILKPAFDGKGTVTFIVLLSSVLYALGKDLKLLKFMSELRSSMTHPEIDLQLIIRNSTKEYAEEIKELQKDLDATSRSHGVKVNHLLYRSMKNALALENEKVKGLDGDVLRLTDAVNLKKLQIIKLQAALELKETEISEFENSSKIVKSELDKMEDENIKIKEIVSLKADEIIDAKQMIISSELHAKKLKAQIIKDNRNYKELTRSIHFLRNEITSLLYDIDAQNASQKRILELLIVDVKNSFSEFQSLEKDLSVKLSNLSNIDVLIGTWKTCMENLILKLSFTIHEKCDQLKSMELEMSTSLASHHASKDTIMDVIKNNWSEKGSVLKYYLSKLQVFCDSSLKMLVEIIHQMGVIESCYKAEFKAISATFGSSNEAFKKFVSKINVALKSFQKYSLEEEKELLRTADKICFHQKFKMQFKQKIDDIKQFLLDLKQMYLDYNDACFSKWNETKNYYQESALKYKDLSDHLSLFQKEMLNYLNNLPQQKRNTLEYSPLKDKTDNVENRILQLVQIHKEMKGNLGEAITVHKKGIDKEFTEIEKYRSLKQTELEKYFDAFFVKLKANSGKLLDELGSIHQISSSNADRFKKDLDSLSSIYLESVFSKYQSVSNNILTKSEKSFKIKPSACKNKNDYLPDFENLLLEEWEATTSTPNVPKKKEFNVLKEKERLIHRMKCLAEQQVSQKPNIPALDEKEEKESKNTSCVSLPSLRSHSKAFVMTEKSFPRFQPRRK